MKFLVDFLPVLAFFITFYVAKALGYADYSMLVAVGVLMIASIIQILYLYLSGKKIEKLHKINLIVVLIFGIVSLVLGLQQGAAQGNEFFKWKVSVINWLFGAVFLGSHFIGKKTIVEHMMGHAINAPKQAWNRLNFMWVCFFVAVGFINVYVMHHFSQEAWVNFKLFGLLGLTFAFLIVQSFYMAKHIKADSPENIVNDKSTD